MNSLKKKEIWISDLTHTAQGISSITFPLGASYVYSYGQKELGNDFDFKLFKFPSHLDEALKDHFPSMLCFSNYSWNLELGYKFASLVKQKNPSVVTMFGGPNFPTEIEEKIEFLKRKPNIDFIIELEGELGFVDLVKNLMSNNFDIKKLKSGAPKMKNTCYLEGNNLISGPINRIQDINIVPSPYLNGALDKFFDMPLVPMIETTRGCPFSCTFCADGLSSKNLVKRYEHERVKEELYLIAKKVKNINELIFTDLNFSMYKQDLHTAKVLADIQKTYNYPTVVSASPGKNMPKRTIEVASMIKGWNLGAQIQSNDKDVLKAIKRKNISSSAYKELIDYGNTLGEKTESAIILGMPEDSRNRHFESLRFGIDNDAKTVRMFQAMLLVGTEMASKATRKKYELKSKFRTIPGCLGVYDILGSKHSVAEIEEIIVESNTLSKKDYIECRTMNLLVTTFYNNSIFEEIFVMLRSMGVSSFDCLVYIKEHPELYSEKIKKIISDFVFETTEDLYDNWDEANSFVLSPDVIAKYIGGDMGTNELLLSHAKLFNEFEDINNLIFQSVKGYLKNKNLLNEEIENYLIDLRKFISLRKKDPLNNTEAVKSAMLKFDFEAITKDQYKIDPKSLPKLEKPLQYNFFHDKEQQKYINNQRKVYLNQAIGLGKLLQQSNMKRIFRNFQRAT
tara:strand:+ start:8131 stop:10167 length:2037 start_codon:yes stop_codon:yes gene_type:complete